MKNPELGIALAIAFLSCLGFANVSALDNGLGMTPPMGISTWYDAGCEHLSENYVLSLANRLISTGMLQLGYNYINIDDCWQVGRDKNGVLIADARAFPRGMRALSRDLHEKGIKFGLYTDRGTLTCQKRPGSSKNEILDAKTFASWGVDYLKEDSCYAPSLFHDEAIREYALMRDALNATKRPIFFSLCGWSPWYASKGKALGNAWRIAPDNVNWNSVYTAAREMERLYMFSGPGGWNDPDFVLGSNRSSKTHLTPRQSRTQFSLWCIMAAPLMLSSPDALIAGTYDFETFSNAMAIRVNQDPLGIPGRVILSTCPKLHLPAWAAFFNDPPKKCTQVWAKTPLKSRPNAVALVFINWDREQTMQVACDAYCMQNAGIPKSATVVSILDVWDKEAELGSYNIVYVEQGKAERHATKPGTARFTFTKDHGLGGPGKIETILDAEGGSAFLIVDWSQDENSDNDDDENRDNIDAVQVAIS